MSLEGFEWFELSTLMHSEMWWNGGSCINKPPEIDCTYSRKISTQIKCFCIICGLSTIEFGFRDTLIWCGYIPRYNFLCKISANIFSACKLICRCFDRMKTYLWPNIAAASAKRKIESGNCPMVLLKHTCVCLNEN